MRSSKSADHGDEASTRQRPTTDTCPECDGDLVTVDDETSCSACGLIVAEDPLDRGPEWRSFEARDRERTGAPRTATRHDHGLSTVIGYDQVANGRKRRRLARMRREHRRARFESKAERNLAKAFGEIARLTSALGLARSTRELACSLFREAQDDGLLRGRSIESIATASVYAACRCGNATRSLAAVTRVATVPEEKLEMGYRVLNRELGLPAAVARPRERIPRLATELDAPDRIRRRALEVAREIEGTAIASGCHPSGLAAACLYLAGQEYGAYFTQEELASAADVSTATIRERHADLRAAVE